MNDPVESNGMTKDRYRELSNNITLDLTEEERQLGWFFSDAFDGLLVHESWPEAKYE